MGPFTEPAYGFRNLKQDIEELEFVFDEVYESFMQDKS